ncbi:MAG: hypothetical protein ACRDPR_17090, partial [Nocardioidaceae bacterium]
VRAIAAAGAETQVAVAGAVTIVDVTGHDGSGSALTDASVGSGAAVTAGPVTNDSLPQVVRVWASHTADVRSFAGVIAGALLPDASALSSPPQSGGKFTISAGASAAVNDVATEVHATADGATITASGDVTFTATSTPTLTVTSLAGALANGFLNGGGGKRPAFAGAGAGADNTLTTTADARVTRGAVTANDGGKVAVEASDVTLIDADAGGVALTLARGAAFSFGVSVALNDIDSTVTAVVDGTTVKAAGDVDVIASSSGSIDAVGIAGAGNATAGGGGGGLAATGAGVFTRNTILKTVVAEIINGASVEAGGHIHVVASDTTAIHAIAGAASIRLALGSGGSNITVAAAIALNEIGTNDDPNEIRASIDVTPGKTIHADEDLLVKATSGNDIDVLALGIAGTVQAGGSGGGGISFTAAGSAAVNWSTSTTTASIVGAKASADEELAVRAGDTSRIRADAGGVAIALGRGPPLAIGASVAINDIDNDVKALVEDADATGASVSVTAETRTSIEVLTIAGGLGVSAGGSSGGGGLTFVGAGAVSLNTIDSDVEALAVDSDLEAIAGMVSVSASASGGSLGTLNLTSTADLDDLAGDDETVADPTDDAAKLADLVDDLEDLGVDVQGDLVVTVLDAVFDATTETGSGRRWLVRDLAGRSYVVVLDGTALKVLEPALVNADAGGAALLVNLGKSNGVDVTVGAAVAVNQMTSDVRAAVTSDPDNPTSSITATAGVSISATSEAVIDVLTVGVAAAVKNGSQGLSITGAGSASVNFITNTVKAELENTEVTPGGNVDVVATDASRIRADGGAVAFSLTFGKSAGLQLAVGIGLAISEITNTVEAKVHYSHIGIPETRAGAVQVRAESTAVIESLAVVAAVQLSPQPGQGFDIAGAGAVVLNTITNTVKAVLGGDSSVYTTEDEPGTAATDEGASVTVSASDTSRINADAAAAALAIKAGKGFSAAVTIGGSWAQNEIGNTVHALVDATIDAGGDVSVTATSAADIDAFALGLSIAGSGGGKGVALSFAGAASVAINGIANSVVAAIDSSTVTAGNGVRVAASDTSSILADAGAGALAITVTGKGGSASGALGAAVALNEIGGGSGTHEVIARIDGSIVTAKGCITAVGFESCEVGVSVTATMDADIDVLTIGISAAVAANGLGLGLSLAGAGSVSLNGITATIEAKIAGDSDVESQAGKSIEVKASDESSIKADAGAGALGAGISGTGAVAGAVGVSIAKNEISNTIRALIDDSDVDADGSLTVSATTAADIDVFALAGALAVTGTGGAGVSLAGVGATTENSISNTVEAIIGNSTLAELQEVTAGGPVTITASDTSDIDNEAIGFAAAITFAGLGGVSGSVAVVLSTNTISNAVRAGIESSDVRALTGTHKVEVSATANATIDSKAVAAAVSVTVSPAGGALAGGGATATNAISGTIEAIVRRADQSTTDSKVSATGAVKVAAKDTSTITSTVPSVAASGALIGAAAAVSLAENTIENTVRAEMAHADVTARSGGITVEADGTQTVTSESYAVAASVSIGGAGSGAKSETTIGGSVEALVSDSSLTAAEETNAVETANGLVDVDASSALTITVRADAGAGGVLAVSVVLVKATIGGTTKASVAASTVLSTGLDVDATDVSTARPSIVSVSAGGVTGTGVEATTTITRAIEASIGAGSVDAGSSPVNVRATSTSTADSDVTGVGAGGISVTILSVNNEVDTTTSAIVADGAVITAEAVTVKAFATNITKAETLGVSVGLVAAGTGIDVVATDSSDVVARVGPVTGTDNIGTVATIMASGTVDVAAILGSTVTADNDAIGVSLVAAGASSEAEAKADPIVKAYLGDRAVVSAPGQEVTFRTSAVVSATANALGVSVALGGAGAGVDVDATVKPTIGAFTESGGSIIGSRVRLITSADLDADADGKAGSGALLVGASGVVVDAEVSPTVSSGVGAATTVTSSTALCTGGDPLGPVPCVEISTTVEQDALADALSVGAGGVVGIGLVEAAAKSAGTTSTYVNGTVSALGVTVATTVDAVADAYGEGNGAALLGAGVGSDVTATVGNLDDDGNILAMVSTVVGTTGDLSGSGSVLVATIVLTDAIAESESHSGAAGAAAFDADTLAEVAAGIATKVLSGGSVTSSDGSVTIRAAHNWDPDAGFHGDRMAEASSGSLTISLIAAVGVNDVTAKARSDVDTLVESGATVAAAQAVLVEAVASNLADADIDDKGGGLVSVSIADILALADGDTSAELLGHVRVLDGGVSQVGANSVTVSARGVDRATSNLESSSGGIVAVTPSDSQAVVDVDGDDDPDGDWNQVADAPADVRAGLGSSGAVIRASGTILVEALLLSDTDSSVRSRSGGLVRVTDLDSDVDAHPDVAVQVGGGADIATGGTITIKASHGEVPPPVSDGTFESPDVDTSDGAGGNRITFDDPLNQLLIHRMSTGDVVTYVAGSSPVSGLTSGRQYGVLVPSVGGATSLQLGAELEGTEVDPASDIIRFGRT